MEISDGQKWPRVGEAPGRISTSSGLTAPAMFDASVGTFGMCGTGSIHKASVGLH